MASRRNFLKACLGTTLGLTSSVADGFGDEGAFNPRILLTGTSRFEGIRSSGPARWAFEVIERTSAPARLAPTTVRADDVALLAEPFALWGGGEAVAPLTASELAMMRKFLALGGVLFVDEFSPERGEFTQSARREIMRVLPEAAPIPIGSENVLFRSFYLLPRPYGRVEGPPKFEAIIRSGLPQIIFSSHDLLGALARGAGDSPSMSVVPGGELQREKAIRMAVNIGLFVLCSNYKDDQVHAPFLMRRRASEHP